MNDRSSPEMSVVLVTPDRYHRIRKTISYLRAQTVRDRLEIVIVAPSADRLDLEESELKPFFKFSVVEVGEVRSIGAANSAGVEKATAPIVALGEDHAYPDPNWAEVLIEAHQKNWAAIGPEVRNGNPDSMTGWADFFINYGPWTEPAAAKEFDHLPGHNSSYKREILLEYGPELDIMLEAESVLHWDLKTKGYRLYLEPRAKFTHLNFELLSSWIPAQFYSGRLFAGIRARDWCFLRRMVYTCAAPLIPLVRGRRIVAQLRRSRCPRRLRVLPPLTLGLCVSAIGEMVGYVLGTGSAMQKLTPLHFMATSPASV